MRKLKQREFVHQLPELEKKICNGAGNQILSCWAIQVSIFLTKASFQLAHKKELWKTYVFLWAGWCLHYTDLITWPLATEPFDVLRKWLLLMEMLLCLVIFIFIVFLGCQFLHADASLLFKWKRRFPHQRCMKYKALLLTAQKANHDIKNNLNAFYDSHPVYHTSSFLSHLHDSEGQIWDFWCCWYCTSDGNEPGGAEQLWAVVVTPIVHHLEDAKKRQPKSGGQKCWFHIFGQYIYQCRFECQIEEGGELGLLSWETQVSEN